jgi:hypothetical protein
VLVSIASQIELAREQLASCSYHQTTRHRPNIQLNKPVELLNPAVYQGLRHLTDTLTPSEPELPLLIPVFASPLSLLLPITIAASPLPRIRMARHPKFASPVIPPSSDSYRSSSSLSLRRLPPPLLRVASPARRRGDSVLIPSALPPLASLWPIPTPSDAGAMVPGHGSHRAAIRTRRLPPAMENEELEQTPPSIESRSAPS